MYVVACVTAVQARSTLVAVEGVAVNPAGDASRVVTDPTAYVDPLIGTGGDGFTVPGATTPFGMTMVSPDTVNPLAYSGYKYEDAAVRGFSFVHVNGAGPDFNAPFGGYRQSAKGREWRALGFEEYLETKAIMGGATS